jgi:hypothetical protein
VYCRSQRSGDPGYGRWLLGVPNASRGALYELIELVDWRVPHVEQWRTVGVPEVLRSIRASRKAHGGGGREFHASVYDNGVPITEAPWERSRFQALDLWGSNGTLDGTLSWYSVNSYGRRDPWTTQRWVANSSAGCTQYPPGCLDQGGHADGSGVVNTWKLAMGRLLSQGHII